MRAAATIILAAGAVLTTIPAYAQPVPPRDPALAPVSGTAIIKGRVVDAQTGNALPRARVRLQGPANRPPVVTDDTGAFKLTEVPAGTVSLFVDRSGYMTTRFPELGKTMRSILRSLTIADGQTMDGLTIPLYRGGVIVGRIVDAHGEPAEFVGIQVMRLSGSGRGKPQQRGGASTNDLGEFRIPRLEPGSYLLRAQTRNNMAPDDPTETQSVPTYYPGVLAIDQAQPIKVERGQTTSGIEIVLLDGVSMVVSGTVVDGKGQPITGAYVNARLLGDIGDMMVSGGGSGLRPDGTFRMKLAPGEYQLEIQWVRGGFSGARPPTTEQQFGRLRISVGTAPISDLTIHMGPGATISGKLAFDGESPPPPNVEQLMVGVGSQSNSSPCQADRGAAVGTDGTFRAQDIVGTCVIRVMGNLGRWSIKSITQGDVDLLDRPIAFEPGQQLRNVQVVLTDKRTELALTVVDEHGLATREYVAIAFATDKTKWDDNSRYLRPYVPPPLTTTRSDPSARGSANLRAAPPERRDSIGGLPAGEYYVIAVADIAAEDARDPAVLERLAEGATRVSLTTDRSPTSVTLRRVALR